MRIAPAQEPLAELVFSSRLVNLGTFDLTRLVRQAWRANIAAGRTGELRLRGLEVAQTLEGHVSDLMVVASRIFADPRHASIEVKAFGQIEARRFSSWRVHGLPAEALPAVVLSRRVIALPMRTSVPREQVAVVQSEACERQRRT